MGFEWDDSYKIGIDEIDRQHHGLVDLVVQLYAAMRQGKGKEVLDSTLNKLVDYTSVHFGTEEAYFNKFQYPKSAAHKKEHEEFTKKVAEFKASYDAGRVMITLSLIDFLSGWLTTHIKGSDREYTEFFKAHGIR